MLRPFFGLILSLLYIHTWASLTLGDIYRWDNGTLVPGTEGVALGPGVDLSYKRLLFADLSDADLTGANFYQSALGGARFKNSVIAGANFSSAFGLTKEQVYETASYQSRSLAGVDFRGVRLADWDFSNQDLTGVNFLGVPLFGANFSGAIIRNALFSTQGGLSRSQLYSTASYELKDLRGIMYRNTGINAWNLVGQNLSGAVFTNAGFINTDFTNATLDGVDFSNATHRRSNFTGVTARQAKFINVALDRLR